MPIRKDYVTLTREQVIEKLTQAKGKRSLRDYAKAMGISHVYLWEVLSGRRAPGPSVLDWMGLVEKTTVVTVYVPKKR